jgi:lipoprotein-anchoring transpeptidase ErfK/SrfK
MRVGFSGSLVVTTGVAILTAGLLLNPAAAQDATSYPDDEAPIVAPAPHALASQAAARRGGYGGGLLQFLFGGDPAAPQQVGRPAVDGAPNEAAPFAPSYSHVAALTAATPGIEEPRPTPAEVPEEFRRQEVDYDGRERAGTIIIDTPHKFLFLVEPGGRAIRYGVGVGRPGFEWSGVKFVSRKAEWPGWTPPAQMLLRRPDLPVHMDGGLDNPLGARALYLGSSLFRIHGTNEPETIGHDVSSGCIRMMNPDVIDLYNRVPVGTKVIVI